MKDRLPATLTRRDATPEAALLDRRVFLGSAACALLAPAGCREGAAPRTAALPAAAKLAPPIEWPAGFAFRPDAGPGLPDAVDTRLTPREEAASHNNFYEFLNGRAGPVWEHAGGFDVDPWTLEIGGACRRPTTLDLDGLFALEHEERLYHFRCVERWAMNVPWCGFPLARLLRRVEPTEQAAYVRFVSAARVGEMPGIGNGEGWPYEEALRLDEAMHDLTFIATGVYGRPLLKQHGAPVRLVVPWKYGYKSPKSIVRIELVAEKPTTYWSVRSPHEYGFLSNVNPNIPHPRWSQAESWWVDTNEHFATPIFNGYEAHVASLYPDEPRTLQAARQDGQTAR